MTNAPLSFMIILKYIKHYTANQIEDERRRKKIENILNETRILLSSVTDNSDKT